MAEVVPLVIGFADWQLPGGGMTPVFVAGSQSGGLLPWNVVDGSVQNLTARGAVAIDRSYFHRLGVTGIGSTAEIRGQRVRVAAVTEGIRSFTTTPYVFCDIEHARSYIGLPASKTSHFIVRLKPGADIDRVRQDIQSTVPGVEALTPGQFRNRSRSFWLFGTGAGAALFGGALLGVIVGTVIVAQTLYSSTKDHLKEFATLRAIGSSRLYILKVILAQALISAVVGFSIAGAIDLALVRMTTDAALPIVMTPELTVGLFGLTVVMCAIAAVAAIRVVTRIDPVLVFAQ